MRGYYSIIQYSPDPSRGEAANVGVAVFTEQPRQLVVKVSETYGRVRRFFEPDERRLSRIVDYTRAVATRLNLSASEIVTCEELEQFTQTMCNDIRMTPPRVVLVTNIEEDLVRLYNEFVGDTQPPKVRRAVVLPTPINEAFERLSQTRKIWSPGRIKVPVVNRTIDIPYAYRNGTVNYIKPAVFAEDARVDDKAARLAVEGDQIRKHPEDELTGKTQRRLIVVSAAASEPAVEHRVAPLFAEYGVLYVPKDHADRFAQKLLQEAK